MVGVFAFAPFPYILLFAVTWPHAFVWSDFELIVHMDSTLQLNIAMSALWSVPFGVCSVNHILYLTHILSGQTQYMCMNA